MAVHSATPSTTVVASLDAQVRAQLIAVLYGRARNTILVDFAVGAFAATFLWVRAPRDALIVWGALFSLVTLARLMLTARYFRANPGPDIAPRWGRYYALSVGASGVVWGAGAFVVVVFGSGDPMLSFFAAMLAAGITASSLLALAPHLLSSYAFMGALVILTTLGFVISGDDLPLAAVGIMFLVASVLYAHHTRRTLAESIALRFENVHLIEELNEKRAQAETLIEELKKKSAEADAANVAKSKFLAAASHDLRQPFHTLTLFIAALDERIHGSEARSIMDNINVSAQALEKLFAALLDISRLDAGTIQPMVCDFRLQELFDRLRNEYAAEAAQNHLAFRCLATDLAVRSDPQLLERILRNYLSNAIRYTHAGEVTLKCERLDAEVCISVADTGKGIARERQQEIFHEFHQLENPERDRTKGLGLGLAIVDRLAKLLGHAISVESTPGLGSVFSVRVPTGDTALVTGAEHRSRSPAANLAGLLVLVIDDEVTTRQGMKTLLAQWGCDVLLAGSEAEAAALLREANRVPDAVIVDYRLREEKTGAQAIQRIHAQYGNGIPALIVTGDTAPDRLREAAASGYKLLHKPVAPTQLRAFLQKVRNVRLFPSPSGRGLG